jgi:hypothetical protein
MLANRLGLGALYGRSCGPALALRRLALGLRGTLGCHETLVQDNGLPHVCSKKRLRCLVPLARFLRL